MLVAYFSATGNTRPLAEYIAEAQDAELYEIIPETPYTDADLDWHDSASRTTLEMNNPDSRPVISGSVENMDDYDIVFLGYPIWWGGAPHIIRTFWKATISAAKPSCLSVPLAAAGSVPARPTSTIWPRTPHGWMGAGLVPGLLVIP